MSVDTNDTTNDTTSDTKAFILLDRDGVINRDLPRSVLRVEDFELLPGAAEAIATLDGKGFGVLVITNQACVGRGDLPAEGLEAIHALMLERLAAAGGRIAGIYVCPHTDEAGCNCRKPRPGLIERARDEHGFEPARTWFVGDSERDVPAAVAAGCRPVLLRSGKPLASPPADVPVFDDLTQFARVLSEGRLDTPPAKRFAAVK